MTDLLPEGWGGRFTLSRQNLRHELWQGLLREWQSVYRYQGLPALLRCLCGTGRLLRGSSTPVSDSTFIDCISCSVIPEIASLWGIFISRALEDREPHVLLADSSGNSGSQYTNQVHTLPLFNLNHGTKLDLLIKKACQAEFVLICDDDIFWLDHSPLDWALEQFARDDKLAVVSFHPRLHKIPQLREALDEAMGSYCILIRRRIWLEQDLSFKFYKSPDWKTIGNYYDTADYANLLLVQRGFHVLTAPSELRAQLVSFYGTSMWGLKILASRGQVSEVVNPNRPDEYKKSFRTALALLGFNDMLSLLGSSKEPLIQVSYLKRAYDVAKAHLDSQTFVEVESDIQGKLLQMKQRLVIWTQDLAKHTQG
jgi:hypothetical protein